MKYVYVVVKWWDYEGESVHGVYPTLELARINIPGGGDGQRIYRYRVGTSDYTEMPLIPGGKVD